MPRWSKRTEEQVENTRSQVRFQSDSNFRFFCSYDSVYVQYERGWEGGGECGVFEGGLGGGELCKGTAMVSLNNCVANSEPWASGVTNLGRNR